MLEKGESALPDEKLMARYARGDLAAFEALMARHRRGLYNFIYRFLGDSQKAEDVFQEVFLEVIKARRRYRPIAKFTTWIYRIARNRCIDTLRKEQSRKTVDLPEEDRGYEGGQLLDAIVSEAPSQEDRALAWEFQHYLQKALDQLSEDQREVFIFREKLGISFNEISEIVGVPVNTVKSRMRYALQNLRRYLIAKGYGTSESADKITSSEVMGP